MSRKVRNERATRVLRDLDRLRSEWEADAGVGSGETTLSRRERFKLLEAETAVLRLLQAESRLSQQIVLALASFLSGSLVTLLVKHLFGG
jgi:hypothetical protein